MSSSQNSNQYINAKDARDEHECPGPSLAMPILIRRDCIGKNLYWERCDRLAKTVVPKAVPESGKEKRRRFAAHASQGEQNPSNDPLGRGLQHDVNDGFPTAYAQRERRLAITVRHE